MMITERATELFDAGYNCSQAVFAAAAPGISLDEETALKIASPFGGGIARTGNMCGALTGALMAVGFRYGKTEASPEVKQEMYARCSALIAAFERCHGATDCRDLIGCELSTEEGQKKASELNVHSTICRKIIRMASELLSEA